MNFLPESDMLTLLTGATLAVKLVMIFLALMSVWSWTIIFFKFFTIGSARKKVMQGYDAFMESQDLTSGLNKLGDKEHSPLARVSTLAVQEFRLLEKAEVNRERKRLLVKDTLRRVLKQGITKEMRMLTRNLPFLATCANAAPFIGLFGTVWGIMHSFHSIGLAQSAALATVAPGISEALIATAIGLLVAIPATIFYNYFLGKLGEIETGMIDFAGAFLNRAEREITWASKMEKDRSKPMAIKTGGGFLNEINVTPFVDVMLVLLIIFMVTAPLMTQGVEVDLPVTKTVKNLPQDSEHLILSVKKDGTIFLDEYQVTLDELQDHLKRLVAKQKKQLFLRADKDVAYGTVVMIMGEIKGAGIDRLGIVAEKSIDLKKEKK